MLGKLPVPGRPTILITVGQGPTALALGAGGVVWIFLLSSILSPLSHSLWETARYKLKYCPKGPLNTKQPTNQSILNWDGAMVLRKLPVPGSAPNVHFSRARTYCACSRCGWACFYLGYNVSLFFTSLWQTTRSRQKYSLKRLLNS